MMVGRKVLLRLGWMKVCLKVGVSVRMKVGVKIFLNVE